MWCCAMQTGQFDQAGPALTSRITYWREIGALLCLKAAGLALLYFLFFAPSKSPVTEQVVARHLLTMPGSGTVDEVNHHDR